MLMATLNCRAPISQGASAAAITVPQSSFWAEPQIESGGSMNLNLIARTGVSICTTDGTTADDTIVVGVSFLCYI
jgi:hypothetical protein